MVLTLAAGLLASCSKEDNAGAPEPDEQLMPISPGVALSTKAPGDSDATTTPVVNQVVKGLTFSFLRADQDSWGDIAFAEQPEHITGTCAEPYMDNELQMMVAPINFEPSQYYLRNGDVTRMWGWYPQVNYDAINDGQVRVSLDFDGKTDVMYTAAEDGSKTEAIKNFKFMHALSQIQFQAIVESGIAKDQWGSITKIIMEEENTRFRITFNPERPAPRTAFVSGTSDILTAYMSETEIPLDLENPVDAGIIMIAPRTISDFETIKLKIATTGKGEMTRAIDLYEQIPDQEFQAGYAYTLTLRFLQDDVEIEVKPAEWRNPAEEVDVEIGGEYPYVKDGKCIISRDLLGSVGDGNFHEAWTSTTVNTDVTSVSAAFEVAETDAMVDVNWYVAAGQQDGTANPDTKNACPEGWRLPTIKELELIQAQAEKLDVEKLVSPDGYWSATEAEGETNHAHIWESGNSLDRQVLKTEVGKVRCVRDI